MESDSSYSLLEEFRAPVSRSTLNPLRTSQSIKWFTKRHQRTAHNKYLNTKDEKLKIIELKQLFGQFQSRANGELKMSDVYDMFALSGVKLDNEDLDTLFHLSSNAKQTRNSALNNA